MATPRRNLVRPTVPPTTVRQPANQRLLKLRGRRDKERTALARWMTRLRRAFHAVERTQLRLSRIERQIAQQEV